MIEKLTAIQEKQLITHREKYLKYGLSCKPANKQLAVESITRMYSLIKKETPYFWLCSSPVMIQIVIQIIKNYKVEKGANLGANLGDNLGANLRANLRANLGANLRANLGANLRDSDFWGQMDAYWICYYQYPKLYLNLNYDNKYNEILDLWDNIGQSISWWYPYEKICFMSDRPKLIQKKGIQLHNENGPALEFRDGYSLWFLNGVDVGKKIVETPAEKLDTALALKETNADVQREIIRKIGAERMLRDTNAKTLDNWNDPKTGLNYKLMDMAIGQNIRRRYLYFEHASMKGVYFAKPVPPETTKAVYGYAWQRKLLTREELSDISLTKEAELIANLPAIVC